MLHLPEPQLTSEISQPLLSITYPMQALTKGQGRPFWTEIALYEDAPGLRQIKKTTAFVSAG